MKIIAALLIGAGLLAVTPGTGLAHTADSVCDANGVWKITVTDSPSTMLRFDEGDSLFIGDISGSSTTVDAPAGATVVTVDFLDLIDAYDISLDRPCDTTTSSSSTTTSTSTTTTTTPPPVCTGSCDSTTTTSTTTPPPTCTGSCQSTSTIVKVGLAVEPQTTAAAFVIGLGLLLVISVALARRPHR